MFPGGDRHTQSGVTDRLETRAGSNALQRRSIRVALVVRAPIGTLKIGIHIHIGMCPDPSITLEPLCQALDDRGHSPRIVEHSKHSDVHRRASKLGETEEPKRSIRHTRPLGNYRQVETGQNTVTITFDTEGRSIPRASKGAASEACVCYRRKHEGPRVSDNIQTGPLPWNRVLSTVEIERAGTTDLAKIKPLVRCPSPPLIYQTGHIPTLKTGSIVIDQCGCRVGRTALRNPGTIPPITHVVVPS